MRFEKNEEIVGGFDVKVNGPALAGAHNPDGAETLSDQQTDDNVIRATARLPGLEIEIIHRGSPAAEAEQISIHLQATPSFEAFGQFLRAANPFALWLQAAQTAWFPWLGPAGALMSPWSVASARKLGPGRGEAGEG